MLVDRLWRVCLYQMLDMKNQPPHSRGIFQLFYLVDLFQAQSFQVFPDFPW